MKKKILLVDDVALFIQLEKSFLSRDLFDIHTARSGKEALEVTAGIGPDLILLDLIMPDMNGDEVCRILKGDPATAHIPIIIVSSDSVEGSEEMCLTAGCDDYIYKPIRRDVLLSSIEKQLGILHRAHPRMDAEISCRFVIGGTALPGVVRTLSLGGAFIQIEDPPEPGREIVVNIDIPGSDAALSLSCSVRWTGRLEPGGPLGAGVQFLEPDAKARARIGEIAGSLAQEGRG